jgi:hypothetical protein
MQEVGTLLVLKTIEDDPSLVVSELLNRGEACGGI